MRGLVLSLAHTPAGRPDLAPSESPGDAGDHPAWVYIRAEPAAVYIAPPLDPLLSPQERALRLGARLLPVSRRRRQHCLHWLSLQICRPGCGLYRPAFRSPAIASRKSATPWRSTSSSLTPSTPALPPLAFTSSQARHSTSGRTMRS